MKTFKKYINEDVNLSANVQSGKIDLDLSAVRDNINAYLNGVTSCTFVTPYIALERVSKVLANYHIFLPKYTFMEGDSGLAVFGISQFGGKMGMNDDGEVVTSDDSPFSFYFEYNMNDRGTFDVFAEIVDEDELQELLDDLEDEFEEEEVNEEVGYEGRAGQILNRATGRDNNTLGIKIGGRVARADNTPPIIPGKAERLSNVGAVASMITPAGRIPAVGRAVTAGIQAGKNFTAGITKGLTGSTTNVTRSLSGSGRFATPGGATKSGQAIGAAVRNPSVQGAVAGAAVGGGTVAAIKSGTTDSDNNDSNRETSTMPSNPPLPPRRPANIGSTGTQPQASTAPAPTPNRDPKNYGSFSTNNNSKYGFAASGSDEDTAANFFASDKRMRDAQAMKEHTVNEDKSENKEKKKQVLKKLYGNKKLRDIRSQMKDRVHREFDPRQLKVAEEAKLAGPETGSRLTTGSNQGVITTGITIPNSLSGKMKKKLKEEQINEIGDTSKGRKAINAVAHRADVEMADQAMKSRPNKKKLNKSLRAASLALNTHERRGGKVLASYIKRRYGLDEEQIDEGNKEKKVEIVRIKAKKGTVVKMNRIGDSTPEGSAVEVRQGKRVVKTGDYDRDSSAFWLDGKKDKGQTAYDTAKDAVRSVMKGIKEEQIGEAVNAKKIAADHDAGHSVDAIVQKHLNKKGDNKDEILKAIRAHLWNKRINKKTN